MQTKRKALLLYAGKRSHFLHGYELKQELRKIPLYGIEIQNINIEAIENYIFSEYVYHYERVSGYTREVALRKALKKYMNNFNIKNY